MPFMPAQMPEDLYELVFHPCCRVDPAARPNLKHLIPILEQISRAY